MTPVIHCTIGNITLVPRIVFGPRKEIHLTRCDTSEKDTRLKSSQRFLLPHSSLRLIQLHTSRFCHGIRTVAAVGTDLTVEEPNPTVSGDVADGSSEAPSSSDESNEPGPPNPTTTSSSKTKRTRPVRKSEMPPVKDEELVTGASFIGKVRSIQPFGCFVDFGAYTDGLVHVSRMSDSYVKDVAAVVSIGQEVKVRLVEANKETRRISLTMRDTDDTAKIQQKKESTYESSEKPRPVRKNTSRSNQKREEKQKSSKFVKGQILDGTVKNLTRSGAFVSLPDGEEGFLPVAEESEGFGGILGSSSLQVGQEVNVRVLRINRGQVTLTMKKEEDVEGLNMKLNKGVLHVATNPFELAFRKNKEIASFLDERERTQKSLETMEQTVGEVDEILESSNTSVVDNSASSDDTQLIDSSDSTTEADDEKSVAEVLHEETLSVDPVSNNLENTTEELSQIADIVAQEDEKSSKILNQSSQDSIPVVIPAKDNIEESSNSVEEENITSEIVSEGGESSANNSLNPAVDEASLTNAGKEVTSNIQASKEIEEVLAANSSVEAEASVIGVKETDVTAETLEQDKQSLETPSSEEKEDLVDSVQVEDSPGELETKNDAGILNDQTLSTEAVDSVVISSIQLDSTVATEDVAQKSTILAENETVAAKLHDAKAVAGGNLSEQTGPSGIGSSIKATISPALVKQLREETGAGMMDCKKALAETEGDIVKAQEFLRKKGLASADKKASRATAEGRIGSYIHDSRIGVLMEVNCETDFVSRGDIFKELVDDLSMQVAACPQVRYLVTEDVPEEIVKKEREIEMQKEDLLTKPENIRSKIVDGRIKKQLEEFALLEQPYIKNDKMVVKDLVKQTIATLGENIKVKRFVRYNLGEGLEKKSQDFAAEVAAQTAAKSSPAVPKDQPAETKEAIEKPKTVAISAALVKQLREETGAGMMDCKKALAESGGDLEKAQEYLRKKGLSSADKKSSRLAAEGRISSYIHDSRIGTLIEVNCETDFVGRSEKFKELVDDLAMQVVACPQVEFVSIEDIPESIVTKEKDIEMQREDLKSKPDQIKEKIVEGRITKRLGELALLEQPFIKDDSIKVKDLVKQTVAALGENIKVRRFVRFTLGES